MNQIAIFTKSIAARADEDSKAMKVLCLVEPNGAGELTDLLPDSCACKIAGSLDEALVELRYERLSFSLCIVLLPLYEAMPTVVMEQLSNAAPGLPVIFVNEDGSVNEAVGLLKAGAHYYFARRPDTTTFMDLVSALPRGPSRSARTSAASWRKMLVGNSSAMAQVAHLIELVAERRSTVLVLGETGTGKELVARALHLASPRSARAFVPINCAAIPHNLLEAEIFGHIKGAFAGGGEFRLGKFEQAHLGTLFLDEIGDLDLDLQSKLLRVLQERELNRIGCSETVRVDVRVIAATNVDLLERVRTGRFREDLYYRLNVVPIKIPSLRERIEDVPLLVRHFVDKVCRREGLPPKVVSAECLERLMGEKWPGNVRQLQNAVEMAVVLSGHRPALLVSDFALTPSFGHYCPPATPHDVWHKLANGPDFQRPGSNTDRQRPEFHGNRRRSDHNADQRGFYAPELPRYRTDLINPRTQTGGRLLSFGGATAVTEFRYSSDDVTADCESPVRQSEPANTEPYPPLVQLPPEGIDFEGVISRIELSLLHQAMDRANGNKKLAADLLGLKRTTLAAKLKSFAHLSGSD